MKQIGKLFKIEREVPESRARRERRGARRHPRAAQPAAGRSSRSRSSNELLEWALEHRGSGAAEVEDGQGHRLHAQAVGGADPIPRRSPHPAGQQRRRESAARCRGRPQEPLRLTSKRGTEVAALFYTLFETAKLSQRRSAGLRHPGRHPRHPRTRRRHPALRPHLICLDSDPDYSNLCLASRRATASTYGIYIGFEKRKRQAFKLMCQVR